MIFHETCTIFAPTIIRKNHEDISEMKLVKDNVACYISLSNEYRKQNASQTEQMWDFVIAMKADETVEVWYEIEAEWRRFMVESVKRRIFSSGTKGSLKIFVKRI